MPAKDVNETGNLSFLQKLQAIPYKQVIAT